MLPVTKEEGAKAILSIIPFSRREDEESQLMASYLAYSFTGFTVKESLERINCSSKDLKTWRENSEFLALENAIEDGEHRRRIRQEILHARLSRNYMGILEKDAQVIDRVMGRAFDEDGDLITPTKEDIAYLMKMRGSYNPSQMDLLDKISGDISPAWNIRDLILVNGGYNAEGQGTQDRQETTIEHSQRSEIRNSTRIEERVGTSQD